MTSMVFHALHGGIFLLTIFPIPEHDIISPAWIALAHREFRILRRNLGAAGDPSDVRDIHHSATRFVNLRHIRAPAG